MADICCKYKRSCQLFDKMWFLLLKTEKNLHSVLMGKFVVKTPDFSSTKKASSHHPLHLTAHDWARKYLTGTFHVDDRLIFSLLCTIVIDHLWKSVVDKHLANFNQWDFWNVVNKVLSVTKFPVVNLYSQLGMCF